MSFKRGGRKRCVFATFFSSFFSSVICFIPCVFGSCLFGCESEKIRRKWRVRMTTAAKITIVLLIGLFTSTSTSVTALNEANPGSVKSVFKAWEERLNSSGEHLESNEGDPELIVYILFTSDVKIRSISVVGGADGTSPSKLRVFINRDGIDFSDAQSMQPVLEWDLVENLQGVLEYQTRMDLLGTVNVKLMLIEDSTKTAELKRDVVATIVYEITPNPSDHKTLAETGGGLSHV